MTDRELLESAAKACGSLEYVAELNAWINIEPDGSRGAWWNPLASDGDAFRLAVKLRIDSYHDLRGANQIACGGAAPHTLQTECYEADGLAATRRAIVRAAAEIGRAMPHVST